MPKGAITIDAFSEAFLIEQLGESFSVKYLCGYLTELNAVTIICERHYVDRHFLDDFVQYYAKSFDAPTGHCQRLHFFSALEQAEIERLLEEAYGSPESMKRSEQALQRSYLGFVVQRPLVGAAVGRTVLKTYPADQRRHYGVVRPYHVNLAGLELNVQGLAYQQQDRGAAVCASTALWSALQRVAYVAGHRTPTPSTITAAARSPYPASHGLNEIQMASALSTLGYIADYFVPAENLALFRAKMVSCLESQLPVILLMTTKRETGAGEVTVGHAVTVTGFSEPTTIIDVPGAKKGAEPMKLKSGSLDVIYVHDDNLGSHAHYELFEHTDPSAQDSKKQMLRRGRTNRPSPSWWPIDLWTVEGALVPKPDKLRLPVESLFSTLAWLRPLFEIIFPSLILHYNARFASGVDYKRKLIDLPLYPAFRRDFYAELALPRHIGIISAFEGFAHLFDAILDVSEVQRDPTRPSLLGFVAPVFPTPSVGSINLQSVGRRFGVPVITGL